MKLQILKTKIVNAMFKVFSLYKSKDRKQKTAHPKIILCFLHTLLLNAKINNQYSQVANL